MKTPGTDEVEKVFFLIGSERAVPEPERAVPGSERANRDDPYGRKVPISTKPGWARITYGARFGHFFPPRIEPGMDWAELYGSLVPVGDELGTLRPEYGP